MKRKNVDSCHVRWIEHKSLFQETKAVSSKSIGKFDGAASGETTNLFSREWDSQSWLRSAKFARLNGRRSEVGWLIFRRMSMKPETFLAGLPLKAASELAELTKRARGTETLLRGRKRTRYYLNHPGPRNIVSNDSPPFLARARINTSIRGTTIV